MSCWADLTTQLNQLPPDQRGPWIQGTLAAKVQELAAHTGRNVIFYASAFLQKPQVPGIFISIAPEDINGYMSAIHGMDCKKGLLLMMHTPGGSAEAAETIVDYLWSKFDNIDVLIPTYAMSAGTMISLSADRIIMGRQSQLGPTDPQFFIESRTFSAHSIVAQFDEAKTEIAKDPKLASAWAPVLASFGPALLQEARKAMAYGESMVRSWLAGRMFKGDADPAAKSDVVAKHFSGSHHGSHGHRISRTEARAQGVNIVDLEDDKPLQDLALTIYHLVTIIFENGPSAKGVFASNGSSWVKNVSLGVVPQPTPPAPPAPLKPAPPAPTPAPAPAQGQQP